MPEIAFVNGKWSALSEAVVSIEDRGFQFGDGVYEVIRTYGKALFGLAEHLKRLEISAGELDIALPDSPAGISGMIREGCEKSGFEDVLIYVQLTRGRAPRNHAYPIPPRPTWVMTFRETKKIAPETRAKGVSVISVEDLRWALCHVKSLNLLPNVMAREAAFRAEAFEAIFVRDGKVLEGAASNLFTVFNNSVVTPPKGPYLLSGVTREILLSVGAEKGLEMRESDLELEDLYTADEIFLTGTTIEVLPVVRLNGMPVGYGRPGKTAQILYEAFQEYVQKQ